MMVTKKHEIRRRYNHTAYLYDRRYREIQKKKYEVIVPYLGGAKSVLDVGCGTGMLLKLLVERAHFVVGVDLSPRMLRAARDGVGGASLVQADADHLPFPDQTFGALVSVTLLQNMPNPSGTIGEFARVLRRGGVLLVTTLSHKHSPGQLEDWANSANLKPMRVGRISDSEDVLCVARRK
jgi:ubiquinone/menaquinone biosynthesis C-methylase UbiE